MLWQQPYPSANRAEIRRPDLSPAKLIFFAFPIVIVRPIAPGMDFFSQQSRGEQGMHGRLCPSPARGVGCKLLKNK
jgi:hypothetical protein